MGGTHVVGRRVHCVSDTSGGPEGRDIVSWQARVRALASPGHEVRHNEMWQLVLDVIVVEPQPGELVRPDVSDEDVGLAKHRNHGPTVLLDVKADALFAAVHPLKEDTHVALHALLRSSFQKHVTDRVPSIPRAAGPFDLDYLGPQVGENPPYGWSRRD